VSAVADGPARRAASHIVLYREADAQCVIETGQHHLSNIVHRKYCQLSSTNGCRLVYYTERTKLTTLCDDRRAVAKFFKTTVWDKFNKEVGPLPGIEDIQISLRSWVGYGEGSLCVKTSWIRPAVSTKLRHDRHSDRASRASRR